MKVNTIALSLSLLNTLLLLYCLDCLLDNHCFFFSSHMMDPLTQFPEKEMVQQAPPVQDVMQLALKSGLVAGMCVDSWVAFRATLVNVLLLYNDVMLGNSPK